jgi:hypothetical protein
MKKKRIVETLFFLFFVCLTGVFIITGFFNQKISHKEFVYGKILQINKGSKGSKRLVLIQGSREKYTLSLTGISDKLSLGDSIVKPANSYRIFLYKKRYNKFVLKDSSETYHW